MRQVKAAVCYIKQNKPKKKKTNPVSAILGVTMAKFLNSEVVKRESQESPKDNAVLQIQQDDTGKE